MDVVALAAALSILVAMLSLALAVSEVGSGTQIRSRLQGVLSGTTSALEGTAIDPLRRDRSALGVYQSIVSGAWLGRIEKQLRQADSELRPMDLFAMRLALAGLGIAIPYLFVGGVLGVLAALAAGAVGFQLPQMWINYRRTKRASKLEEQLPDTLTFVANSLKAGFGLLQSLSLAAEQMEHPIATELAQTVHETNVGSSTEEAFTNLSDRCENYDIDLVVTAVLIQRSAGGNLAEILETVTETMRERVRIRGEINTLTAQQRMTGVIIALLPVGVGGLFLVISPEYISVLFTETVGRVMLAIGTLLEVVGVLIIRRILAIEV